jgi:hypothetical protein
MATLPSLPTPDTSIIIPPLTARNPDQEPVRLARTAETRAIAFPPSGFVGVAAKFAEAYAREYESPKEFFYWDCLALIGAIISGRVRADFDLPCQPRLYVVKVAESAWGRKSTSTQLADRFIRSALELPSNQQANPSDLAKVICGVGSAEGLGKSLMGGTQRVALVFDEFRRFQAKACIKGGALLSVVNELYERNEYDNYTLSHPLHITDGHLVFLANSTFETYKNLLDVSEFVDLGFLNRLFVVTGNSDKRVAQPKAPPDTVLAPIREELAHYINDLPPLNTDGSASHEVVTPLTPEARQMWNEWYLRLEETGDTARLDNLGMRLMDLLAFSSGQRRIDERLLQSVLDILEYERKVRSFLHPIDAANPWAAMEQKIRNVLAQHGPLSKRDIRRYTNADRYGLKVFEAAMSNLICHGEIRVRSDGRYELVPE